MEPTGAVTRYRGERPNNNNNNNNNHTALAERFQLSILHELRQLGLYINMDTPNTAHQLDAEAVAAEVAYTLPNTQVELFGRGRIGPHPEHLQGGHGLPKAARWKAASDKEIVSVEKHDVLKLVPITSVPAGHKIVGTR